MEFADTYLNIKEKYGIEQMMLRFFIFSAPKHIHNSMCLWVKKKFALLFSYH